ncbi:MAG: right-handed parallel beta-helix repeat-containing protein [Planctomycetes bacterium]|nr:right-handed parallel beta-helix repeat-containing protein [Planctomycetota bacterium]
MSMIDRWRSWFRRPARRSRSDGLRPRPAVEELEKREVLSGFGTGLLSEPDESRFPMPSDVTRFLPPGTDLGTRFLQVDTDAPPAVAGNRQDPLASGIRFIAPGNEGGFLALLRQDSGATRGTPPPSAMNTIAIDADWLAGAPARAGRGPGPYVLDQAGATYVLGTDVRTEGTAFVVAAPDVTLDLNGHTVVYGDSAPLGLRNGGFEEGSGRDVPGWDLSDAPAASLTSNTSHLFGNQVLHLGPFRGIQRIVSDPVAIPAAGRTYAATITPSGIDARSTLRLTVLDAITGAVLGSGVSDSTPRGYSAVASFTPLTTDPVQLRIEVIPPPNSLDSLDLDQATLTVSNDYGIVASHISRGGLPGWVHLSPEAQAVYRNATNFTVKNGSVVQGQGNGYASSPLFFRELAGVTVDNVQTHATGMDTQSLDATYATAHVTILNSTFREDIDNISNRMLNFATLKLNNTSAPIDIEGNHLLGSPQAGIVIARNDPQFTVVIRNNEFRQNAVTTNGYGILLSAAQNFEIAGNTIVPANGKGIDLDGYAGAPLLDGNIHDNYVDVQEVANREYPRGLEAVALRLRNNLGAGGVQRILNITNNTFIARTGPGQLNEAQAVRISYANNDGAMDNAGITLQGNLIKAIVSTPDESFRAKALVLDRVDDGINLQISGNVLESNDVSLAVADTGGDVTGVDLAFNTLRRSDEGAPRPYTGILAGYDTHEIRRVRLIGTGLDNGATANVVWVGAGFKDLAVG